MSARSLCVAAEKVGRVKAALKRCAFASQQALATESGFSLSTVKSFLNGRPVDRLNFIELCEKLGLDWQAVVAIETEEGAADAVNWEESPFIVGSPITKPRQFFGRERELRRLFALIKRLPLQNAAIIGPRRAGKTSLLYYLMKICTTPEEELRPGQKRDWLPNPE
ncbi:MAG: ATP-binding protein [Synechococcales cyanobacterium CRU_2_2]|nr:ATP-binding protein [Synechococcales cyanobacterium CRU_2_2]